MSGVTIDTREDHALELDGEPDPASRRSDFLIPPAVGGEFPLTAYLAGNSLGLQPRATRAELMADLDAWEQYGVHGHSDADRPWFPYHEALRAPAARLVGAEPREVVIMNSLTVNLHLMLASFYRPTPIRHRIVIEDYAFSSDSYAVRSHVALRGHDPDTAVLRLRPRPGEDVLRTEDVMQTLHDHAHSIATVMIGGVNYLTGEVMDMAAITAAGHEIGATVGWDLAHAAGQHPPAPARLGRRLRGLVLVQVPQLRAGRRSPARSSTPVTSTIRRCRGSRAGGAPTRRAGSR